MDRLHDVPRVRLWRDATPLERQHNLAMAAGAASILVKRDDCNGLAFGGNKVRQLEFYLGEAKARGADTVLSTGAVQSNFVRTAAAAARKLGMDIHIQLEARVGRDDDTYRRSGNVLLDTLLGATIHRYPRGEDEAGADRRLNEIADSLRGEGRRPYVVPMHPDHPPLGALGYVTCAEEEMLDQMTAQGPMPDEIFVASGSGNTHAGLLYGLRRLGCDVPVMGVCVRRDAAAQKARIAGHVGRIAELLGTACPVADDDIRVTDAVLPPGYGKAGPETMAAIRQAAQTEALILDPVYTGKVMAALLADAAARPGRHLLMIHSGGGPAVFAYADDLYDGLSDSIGNRQT